MTAVRIALVVCVGAFTSLERKSFGELMLSRPIVVATVVAAILGEAGAGLAIGVALELFFLGSSAYGASTPEHETFAALAASAIAARAYLPHHPAAAFALAVLFALPFARLGRRAEAAIERWHVRLVEGARERLETGDERAANRRALAGLVLPALAGAAAVGTGLLLAPWASALAHLLPPAMLKGLSWSWALFLGVCAALSLKAIRSRKALLLSGVAALAVLGAFALATYVGW